MATQTLLESPSPPSWVVELNSTPSAKPKSILPDPPGFTSGTRKDKNTKNQAPSRKPPTAAERDTLKLKKAWELAIAPAKQLPMSAIGMYMTGNSLQIFSIFMVFTLFKAPITALMNIQNTFSKLETEGTRGEMWKVKTVFVLCNLMALALGVWKINKMGLLPTTRSDWLAWETAREPLERAYPAWET
ncbi:uncharacterized protein PV09_03119 [Verruconis gallopava]|uniref:ER membrane protein complex subunit 4 n=1 Tax=Verruconis gallopava TaxID=253628 RepID=A0A0D1XT86_9PEZI|nr:uncharacterized protein PV09_03119 [Verruconis gallopava]KIW05926.1 hypothetical protein PV09_03119 [Verruconis gallopava]